MSSRNHDLDSRREGGANEVMQMGGLSLEPVKSFKDLGVTPLAIQLGLADEQTNGHWCSRCEGIWFGYTLEAECPVCGNRKG